MMVWGKYIYSLSHHCRHDQGGKKKLDITVLQDFTEKLVIVEVQSYRSLFPLCAHCRPLGKHFFRSSTALSRSWAFRYTPSSLTLGTKEQTNSWKCYQSRKSDHSSQHATSSPATLPKTTYTPPNKDNDDRSSSYSIQRWLGQEPKQDPWNHIAGGRGAEISRAGQEERK
jgi:hypothetical protein